MKFAGSWLLIPLAVSASAQLSRFDVEPVGASTTNAGQSITLRITALTVLDVAIPLYLPLDDITISVDADIDVEFDNLSGGFSFVVDPDVGIVIDADGILRFDGNGQITIDVRTTTADTAQFVVDNGAATGNTTLTWTAAAAHELVFTTEPGNMQLGDIVTPVVEIIDEFGNVVTDDDRMITLDIDTGPDNGVLQGDTAVETVAGIAAWLPAQGLKVAQAAGDYTLKATHDGAAFAGEDVARTAAFTVAGDDDDDPNAGGDDPNGDDPNSSDDGGGDPNGDDGDPNGGGDSDPGGGDPDGGDDSDPDDSSDDGDDDDDPFGIDDQDDDPDTDGDGIPDDLDDAPDDADADHNGVPDGLEVDSDNDGLPDANDTNPRDDDSDDDGVLDGDDNCPDYANADQADADNDGVGDFCEDSDDDGIVDGIEAEAGDANGDGVPDSAQANVATVATRAGDFITLVTRAGLAFARSAKLQNPSPTNSPAGVDFPLEFVRFDIDGLVAGAGVDIQMLWAVEGVNSVYMFGPTPDDGAPHWYEFSLEDGVGASIQGSAATLTFVDGGKGDADLIANGKIRALVGPAVAPALEPAGCGGLCGPVGLMTTSLTGLGIAAMRRRG